MFQEKGFSPIRHIPRFSRLLLECMQTPILIYLALAGNFVTFFGAAVFYWLEVEVNPQITTYFDSLWYAFCTVTTVGYGDIIPATVWGRVVSIIMMVTGIGLFFSFSALLVSLITALTAKELFVEDAEEMTHQELAPVFRELRRIERELKSLKPNGNDNPG